MFCDDGIAYMKSTGRDPAENMHHIHNQRPS